MEERWIVAGLVDVHRGSAGVGRNGLNVFSWSGSHNVVRARRNSDSVVASSGGLGLS